MKKEDIFYLEEAVKNGAWLKISIPANYIREVAVYKKEGKSFKRETEIKGETLNFALIRASLHIGGEIDSSKRDGELKFGYAHANSYIDYLLLNGYYISVGVNEDCYILKVWHKTQNEKTNKEIYSISKSIDTSLLSLLRNVEVSWARYLVEPLSKREDIIDINEKNEFFQN